MNQSLMIDEPSVVTVPRAARMAGVSKTALLGWVKTCPQWAGCVSHTNGNRAYLSVQRMRDRGLLIAKAKEPAHVG